MVDPPWAGELPQNLYSRGIIQDNDGDLLRKSDIPCEGI